MKRPMEFIDGILVVLQNKGALKGRDVTELKRDFENRSDDSFEEFLIDENLVSREDLLEALGDYYNVRFLDLSGEFLDNHLLRMFPIDVMLRHLFVPYIVDENMLILVASDPSDPELSEVAGRFVSYEPIFWVGYFRDIEFAIEEFYDESLALDTESHDLREEHELEELADNMTEAGDTEIIQEAEFEEE